MKKLIILLPLLLLTGCTKKIVCKSISEDNETVTQTYKIRYNDDNITKIRSEKTYKFNTKEEFESYENIMNYNVVSLRGGNIDVSYKKKNTTYILIEEYNVKKMNDDDLKNRGLYKSKSKLIEEFKNIGLECK